LYTTSFPLTYTVSSCNTIPDSLARAIACVGAYYTQIGSESLDNHLGAASPETPHIQQHILLASSLADQSTAATAIRHLIPREPIQAPAHTVKASTTSKQFKPAASVLAPPSPNYHSPTTHNTMAVTSQLLTHIRHFSMRATYIPPKCRTRTAVAGLYLTAALTIPFLPPALATRSMKEGSEVSYSR